MKFSTRLTAQVGIDIPIICGAMYPCSNPELVAATSAAGAIGIVQPVSMTYVHGHDFREGLKLIRETTSCPIGMNALIEESSRRHHQRIARWVEIALEEGVRFFITSLGKPRWIVDLVRPCGGIVDHDVTQRRWAEKAVQSGVHGLIGVNRLAGGHAGGLSPEALLDELQGFGLPVICAGGVGNPATFRRMMQLGYDGVQMGTRFIASAECLAHPAYKQAILDAQPQDIVLTERLTGVPLAVINNEYVKHLGTRANPLAKLMFRFHRTKRLMRSIYAMRSLRRLKRGALTDQGAREYWQAGKSVEGIRSVESVGQIVREFAAAIDAP